jgi:hypothetical protein
MNLKSLVVLTVVASAAPLVTAGPLAYAICQTGVSLVYSFLFVGSRSNLLVHQAVMSWPVHAMVAPGSSSA